MKNKRIIRILTMFLAVMLCMMAFSVTAFAGGGEEAETTAEPETEQETTAPVSLTPDGNLTLVDDLSGEQTEDKQFITVVTKDDNYFYIIIDRVGDSENVYFLNLVDEADLMALIEDADGAATSTITTPAVTTPEPEATEPVTSETEPETNTGGMGGTLLIVLIIAALGGGAFYYFKVLKPKQSVSGNTGLEEFDFDDENEETEYISEEEAADTGEADEQEDDE